MVTRQYKIKMEQNWIIEYSAMYLNIPKVVINLILSSEFFPAEDSEETRVNLGDTKLWSVSILYFFIIQSSYFPTNYQD